MICFLEAVVQTCSLKKVFLEMSQNSQESTRARISFLIKLPETCNFIKKEILAQVFYCEFCEISKSAFLHRTPLVAASDFHNILGSILGIRDIEIDYSINEI